MNNNNNRENRDSRDNSTKISSTPVVTMLCDDVRDNQTSTSTSTSNKSLSLSQTFNLSQTLLLSDYSDSRNKSEDIGDTFSRTNSVSREKVSRRTRVSQCKNLRGFILGFENNWLLKYGVVAKVNIEFSCYFLIILFYLLFLYSLFLFWNLC